MSRHGRAQRGQAMVEMALGTLVFVTILIFGIYFAEVGYLSAKVPQAAAFALYEGTGRRVHQYSPSPQDVYGNVSDIDETAAGRFRDFDALTETGGTSLTKVFARATALQVSCEEEGSIAFAPSRTPLRARVYSDKGGTACNARAEIRPENMTREFLEGAPFQAQHYSGPTSIQICAFGRASGGDCPGRVGILYGDWGLAGQAESGSCGLSGCGNTPYYNAVESMYVRGWDDAPTFARNWAGDAPTSGNEFYMSYRGVELDYMQPLSGHGSRGRYNTGGPEDGARRTPEKWLWISR
ncbi:MAG: hypothetical protein WBV82_30845 [Myxococcaceae bacterium]